MSHRNEDVINLLCFHSFKPLPAGRRFGFGYISPYSRQTTSHHKHDSSKQTSNINFSKKTRYFNLCKPWQSFCPNNSILYLVDGRQPHHPRTRLLARNSDPKSSIYTMTFSSNTKISSHWIAIHYISKCIAVDYTTRSAKP